jgi:hypothetical protein
LHALVTLNDPVYLECAQAFAKRMQGEGGASLEKQLGWGLTQATQAAPNPKHVQTLARLHKDATKTYKTLPSETKALAGTPEEAALVLVANTILNLDAATKK